MTDINLTSFNSTKTLDFSTSPEAVTYIERMVEKNQDPTKPYFRVAVEGGGCSGFQYNYLFDNKNDDDFCFEYGDIKVLVSPETYEYIKGSILDFYEDFGGSGLTVKNPNATGTCGCGVSFSV